MLFNKDLPCYNHKKYRSGFTKFNNFKIRFYVHHISLTSAQDVSTDLLDAIKATFKSKPITIIVEEDEKRF